MHLLVLELVPELLQKQIVFSLNKLIQKMSTTTKINIVHV